MTLKTKNIDFCIVTDIMKQKPPLRSSFIGSCLQTSEISNNGREKKQQKLEPRLAVSSFGIASTDVSRQENIGGDRGINKSLGPFVCSITPKQTICQATN